MKGPYERLKYDLRRIWECPVCKGRRYTQGNVVTCLCACQESLPPPKWQWMRLVADGVRRRQETATTPKQ